MNRILLFVLGTLLVIGSVACAFSTLSVDQRWIIVGCAIILGLGIMSAAKSAKGTAKTNVHIED